MDDLVKALAPGFVAGFAVQRVLEIFDPVLNWIVEKQRVKALWPENRKAATAAILSITVGALIAGFSGIRVLHPLNVDVPDLVDAAVTALVISAGTEGMNSILKYLGYKKDSADADAKAKTAESKEQLAAVTDLDAVAHEAVSDARRGLREDQVDPKIKRWEGRLRRSEETLGVSA